MSTQNKKGSVMPLIIIVLVVIVAVGGGAYLYNQSKPAAKGTTSNTGNSATPAKTPVVAPANAPPGAAIGINMIGDPSAIVTIEEFADFQCPMCGSVHPIMKDVQSAYAGNKNVRFIFRNYPLPMHDKSYEAATFVEAAGMQGTPKFWAMMDQIFSNQQAWSSNANYKEMWKEYATKIGLDIEKWQSDAAGLATKGRIDLDIARAKGMGVNSTPTVYINNKAVQLSDMNVPTMRKLIDTEIETAGKPAVPPANNADAGK